MTEELLSRINYLAKKSKTDGLTEEEKEEQKNLRMQYIAEFRQGMQNTLDNVYVLDKDGQKKKIQKKDSSNE